MTTGGAGERARRAHSAASTLVHTHAHRALNQLPSVDSPRCDAALLRGGSSVEAGIGNCPLCHAVSWARAARPRRSRRTPTPACIALIELCAQALLPDSTRLLTPRAPRLGSSEDIIVAASSPPHHPPAGGPSRFVSCGVQGGNGISSIFVPFLPSGALAFREPKSRKNAKKQDSGNRIIVLVPVVEWEFLGAISTPDGPHSFAAQTRTWVGGENGVPSRTLLISLSQI